MKSRIMMMINNDRLYRSDEKEEEDRMYRSNKEENDQIKI